MNSDRYNTANEIAEFYIEKINKTTKKFDSKKDEYKFKKLCKKYAKLIKDCKKE